MSCKKCAAPENDAHLSLPWSTPGILLHWAPEKAIVRARGSSGIYLMSPPRFSA